MGFTNPYPASRLTVDSTNSLVTGMQAWFPLTQGSGTVAQCILHPSHTGTIGSGVTWESSERGTVAVFDGTSNAKINFSSQLVSGQTLSFSVWLYVASSVSGRRTIYCDGQSFVKNDFRYDGNGKRFVFDHYTPSGEPNKTNTDYGIDDRWIHVVVTQDSSTTKIYYDGVLKHTGTAETYASSAPTVFNIGSRDGSNSFEGKMQNFQAWDRVISADEVALLHARPWEGSNYGDIWPYSPPASTAMTLSSDAASSSIMADIEGWWVMTDGSGSTLKDISGNGRDATLYGTNTWENETLGTANRFDNSVSMTSHAETADTQPDLTGGYTFTTWVKHEELAQGGSNRYGAGIVLGNSSGSADFEVYFRGNHTAQHPQVVHNRSNGGTLVSYYINNANYTDDNNVWVNFAVTYDGSIIKIYRDGVYQAASGSVTAPLSTSGYKIYLNELPVVAANGGLTCSMQNTRLWSRALSDSEIATLYERPWEGIEYGDTFHYDPPAPASMLPLTSDAINTDQELWLPLTETDDYASGAADISGGGNNGTQSGGVTSKVSLLGGVASFDGADDRIDSNSITMPTAYPFTVSAWIKTTASTGGSFLTVAAFSGASTNNEFAILGVDKNTSRARWTIRAGSDALAIGGPAINDGEPHLITGVSVSANDHRIYLDGVLVGTSTTSLGTNTYGSFSVGCLPRSSAIQFFDGEIGNVRYWSRALTADEIWSIYATNPWLGSNYKLASGSTDYNFIFRSKRFRRLA